MAELPLRESITPAVRMGGAVELLLVAVGALLGLGALSIALRRYAAKNRSCLLYTSDAADDIALV